MNRAQLVAQIRAKKSFLCIGLDSDLQRIPRHLLSEKRPVWAFNKAIIEATGDLCVAYKINTAFYEARGTEGWKDLEDSLQLIPSGHLRIADAKRADIGNTSAQYARAFFEQLEADAVTLAPYMGYDSIAPFLQYENKWSILLALTSNKGSEDFQQWPQGDEPLYRRLLSVAMQWAGPEQLMFVVGATHPEQLAAVRQLAPDYFFLVPGVGAQGGKLADVVRAAMTPEIGLLVNASRSIIYAGDGPDFAEKARAAALELQREMAGWL